MARYIIECQQGINLALCSAELLDELVSKSSGDEDSSLSEGNSSSVSTLLSAFGSSGTRSEMSEVSSVDSTSIIDKLLGIVEQVHDQMETGKEDNTISMGEKIAYSRFA